MKIQTPIQKLQELEQMTGVTDERATTEILLKFVTGETSLKEFETQLYTNQALETYLRDPSINWSGTYVSPNLYDYLIAINYNRTEGKVNAIGAIELFLQKKNIPYTKSEKYSKIFDLFLSTQPKYLDIDSAFFEKYILPSNIDIPITELKQIIRGNFNQYFKFQNKPPKWIQAPKWIIKSNKPLFFIGQIEFKNDLCHDNGFVYVFMDTETGDIETVKQFY